MALGRKIAVRISDEDWAVLQQMPGGEPGELSETLRGWIKEKIQGEKLAAQRRRLEGYLLQLKRSRSIKTIYEGGSLNQDSQPYQNPD